MHYPLGTLGLLRAYTPQPGTGNASQVSRSLSHTVGLFNGSNPTGYFTRFENHLALIIGEAPSLPFQTHRDFCFYIVFLSCNDFFVL